MPLNKKIILFPLLISPLVVISCSNTNISNNVNKEFEKVFNEFVLRKRPNVNLSNILAKDINSEEILLRYFEFDRYNGFEYNYIDSKVDQNNQTQIIVTYLIKFNELEKIKTIVLSGFKNNNSNIFDKEEFDNEFANFNLEKKANVDLSKVKSFDIDSEEQLLKYFKFNNKNKNISYKFIKSKIEVSDTSQLIVKYLLFSKTNESICGIKTFKLSGFKNDLSDVEIDFENAVFNLSLEKKQASLDISTILASDINNQIELEKYFEVQEFFGVKYQFISSTVDINNASRLLVKYKLISENDNTLQKEKIIIVDGFKDPNINPPTIEEEKVNNFKIANQIVNLIRINNINSHHDISARDFVRNYEREKLFEKYFEINRDDILDLNMSQFIQFPIEPVVKRLDNDLNSVLFTINFSVGKTNTIVRQTINIKIEGFKSLLTNLDCDSSPSISLPTNAKSYKGLLEPIIIEELNENAYKNRIDQKFTFEQLKLEIMYQLRFWMYQMFSDNFSELNYWIEGGTKPGDKLVGKIEGIVKNNISNLEYWPQQYGDLYKKTENLKSGQKIVIELEVLNTNNWRPSGYGYFGFLDGIKGFSYAKGCSNINTTNFDKGAYATILPTSSFNLKINNQSKIKIDRWLNFGTVMFTIGATRPK